MILISGVSVILTTGLTGIGRGTVSILGMTLGIILGGILGSMITVGDPIGITAITAITATGVILTTATGLTLRGIGALARTTVLVRIMPARTTTATSAATKAVPM